MDTPPPDEDAGMMEMVATPALNIAGGTCGAAGVTLTWNEVAGASYVIEYGLTTGMPTSVEVPPKTTSYMTPKLSPGSYSARIKAKKGTIESPFSASKAFTVVMGNLGSYAQMNANDFGMNTNMGVTVQMDGVVVTSTADFGNGADGVFNPNGDTTLSDTKSFTSFTIPAGVTVTATGSNPLVVKVQGAVKIDGILRANGANGGNGVTFNTFGKGGIGDANGSNGGDGVIQGSAAPGQDGQGSGAGLKGTNWQGGSGAGYANMGGNSPMTQYGQGIQGGPAYGSADLMTFAGGSGGGGGSGGNSCGSGGGGAGGGAIQITAGTSIAITGSVLANGGNGGSDGNGNCGGGGGGSGGAIWLRSPTLTNSGTISALGGAAGASQVQTKGGAGSDGRIRLDGNTIVAGTTTPMPGFTGTLPYMASGTTITQPIAPQNVCAWGKLTFSIDTTAMGSNVVIDILDANNAVLAPNVMNNADLSTIAPIAAAKSIKLRATLTAGKGGTPKLTSWKVEYYAQ